MKLSVKARIAVVMTVVVVANVIVGAASWGLYQDAARSGARARAAAERAQLAGTASERVTAFLLGSTDLALSVSRPDATYYPYGGSEERTRLYGSLMKTEPTVDQSIARLAAVTPGSTGADARSKWQAIRNDVYAWINTEAEASGADLRIARQADGTFAASDTSNLTLPAEFANIAPIDQRKLVRVRAENFKSATLGGIVRAANADASAAAAAESQARLMAQIGTIVLVGLSALLAALLGIGLYRAISLPLSEAKRYADEVAGGNYEATIQRHSADEIGVLTHAVENMKDKLVQELNVMREMAGVVMFTTDGVREALASTTEAVERPGHEAAEINAELAEVSTRVNILRDLSRQMLGIQ